jgi:hypothetical protein
VAAAVDAVADALYAEHGPALTFHCGGQRGVDTWAAAAAERLRLPLDLYLPQPIDRFTVGWASADIAALERSWAYARAREVVAAEGDDDLTAYTRRNQLLAERGDWLEAFWTGLGGGGTAETIALARRLGKPVREHCFAASGRVPRAGERGI